MNVRAGPAALGIDQRLADRIADLSGRGVQRSCFQRLVNAAAGYGVVEVGPRRRALGAQDELADLVAVAQHTAENAALRPVVDRAEYGVGVALAPPAVAALKSEVETGP